MNLRERRANDRCGSEYESSDDDSIETMSNLSGDSITRRDNDFADEERPSPEDLFEDTVTMCLGEARDAKSSPRRSTCLQMLCKSFAGKYTPEFLASRPQTMTDLIERCLKKGKTEEQIAASNLAAIIVLQYGASPEGAEVQRAVRKTFITGMNDNSLPADVRERMAAALGVTTFIAEEEIHNALEVMEQLSAVFSCSCGPRGEVKLPIVSPGESKLHQTALLSWGLLLTVAEEHVEDLIDRSLATVTALLHSDDVDVRVAAGEVLALMYEIGREQDSDFEGDDLEKLCEDLHNLATDSTKHRAKRERRSQRASFRDIERAVRDGQKPKIKVQFGVENMALGTWEDKRTYDALCSFLGSGMNHHLRFNPGIRSLFGLGAPLLIEKQDHKGTRAPRNVAEERLQTQCMAERRTKRMDFIGSD